MRVLIDNGHGVQTPGKRSPVWPDGSQLLEWSYTRMIARSVVAGLKAKGIAAELLVPEDDDISLSDRCRRVNKVATAIGRKNCLLVSIHVNACNGKARGWEVHTYTGQSISDTYATIFHEEAKKLLSDNTSMRGDWSDKDPDWDSNFAMLRDTQCPSVLTENCFMDNKVDCDYLLSQQGQFEIVALHVNAITRIINLL